MKGFIAAAALVGAVVASPMPQGGSVQAPAGCLTTKAGTFSITVTNVTKSAKRDLVNRQSDDGSLTLTLNNGVLKDQNGRTGNIVANHQFQFDNPIQSGALITSGWSVCGNGSLALTSAIFYQCLSGNFYNLYDQSQGNQCNPVYIVTSGASSGASQAPDGQPQAATATTKVTQLSDGQPQATTATVSQISDGQIQATTKPAAATVSQITDGQIQASTGAKVSQISDGQIQATTKPAATTGAKVSQISDGQIQATTKPAAPTGATVSQISDGQIQATTAAPTVSQISDGQIQAPTSSPAVATFTGAANRELAGGFAFVAGIVGAVALL